MGLFNKLLKGSPGTPSTSSGSSESQSTGFSGSLSGSQSSSLGDALSKARSQSGQSIFQPQADVLQNQFFPQLSQLFGQNPNDFLAGFNTNQNQGQQASLDAANALGGGVIDPSTQAFQGLLGAGGADSPQVQAAIQAATNPIFQNFEQRIAPSLRRALGTEVGQAGGSRGGLQIAKAGQDALRTAGDIGSQIALQAQQQGLGAQQGALNFAPQLAQLFGQPGSIQQGIGGIQQQQQQGQLNAPIDFMTRLQALIGNPTVLGQSSSATDSSSSSRSAAEQAAASLGLNQSTSSSQNQSTGGTPASQGLLKPLLAAGAVAAGSAFGGPVGGVLAGGVSNSPGGFVNPSQQTPQFIQNQNRLF